MEEPSDNNTSQYPFTCIASQPYYQMLPPHVPYYGYNYLPESVSYMYPVVPAPNSIYWM